MNCHDIWMRLFGTTQWLGLDVGFWVSLAVVALFVVIMNVVVWNLKPKAEKTDKQKNV